MNFSSKDLESIKDLKAKIKLMEARNIIINKLNKGGRNVLKSMILVGSYARGDYTEKSDFDFVFIIDDKFSIGTNLDKLKNDIYTIINKIDPNFTVLECLKASEFISYLFNGEPAVYRFVVEGIPLFDDGFFQAFKNAYLSGNLKYNSLMRKDRIWMTLDNVDKKLVRISSAKKLILALDCYNAMIELAQSLIIYHGGEPVPPALLANEIHNKLVKKGILKRKYMEWIKEIVRLRKDIEHGNISDISGEDIDIWISRIKEFQNEVKNIVLKVSPNPLGEFG